MMTRAAALVQALVLVPELVLDLPAAAFAMHEQLASGTPLRLLLAEMAWFWVWTGTAPSRHW